MSISKDSQGTANTGDKANKVQSEFPSQAQASSKLIGAEPRRKSSIGPRILLEKPCVKLSSQVSMQQKEPTEMSTKIPVVPAEKISNALSKTINIPFDMFKLEIYDLVVLPGQRNGIFRPLFNPIKANTDDEANEVQSESPSQGQAGSKVIVAEPRRKPSSGPRILPENPCVKLSSQASMQQKKPTKVSTKIPVVPAEQISNSLMNTINIPFNMFQVPIYELVVLPGQKNDIFRPLINTLKPPAKSYSDSQQQPILQPTSSHPPSIPLQESKTNSSRTPKPKQNKKEIAARKNEKESDTVSPTTNQYSG